MPAEQQIAAPARLARIEFVSPWRAPLPTGVLGRALRRIADAWREGMALYVRAGAPVGRHGWFG